MRASHRRMLVTCTSSIMIKPFAFNECLYVGFPCDSNEIASPYLFESTVIPCFFLNRSLRSQPCSPVSLLFPLPWERGYCMLQSAKTEARARSGRRGMLDIKWRLALVPYVSHYFEASLSAKSKSLFWIPVFIRIKNTTLPLQKFLTHFE